MFQLAAALTSWLVFFADGLSKKFGQPVIVENRGGVAGNLGGDFVYHADPDGYTLMAAQPAPLTINPLLYKTLTFDPTKFVPVAIMTSIANVLMVRKDFPADDIDQFLTYAKSNPGKINYASQGLGTTTHLSAELQRAGGTPAEAAEFIKSETAVWSEVIKAANIPAQ